MREQRMKLKQEEWWLLCSIILSPLRCYGIILAGFNFSLFRLAGLMMMGIYLLRNHFNLVYNADSKWLGLITCACVLQAFYSSSLSGTYSNFFSITYGFAWAFFAYAIINNNPELVKVIIKTFTYSAVIPIAIGIYQWVGYKTVGHVPALPLQALVASEGKTGMTFNIYARITSCFGDPAYFSTFLVIYIATTIQSLISNVEFRFSKKHTLISVVLVLLGIIELLMSMSVTGIVGLGCACVLLIILNSNDRKTRNRLLGAAFVLLMGLIIYLYYTNFELIDILTYKTSHSGQEAGNMFGRERYILNALNKFILLPLTGTGFGGLSIEGSFSTAHSSMLTVLGQQGIIVFLMHLAVLIIIPFSRYRSMYGVDKAQLKCFLIPQISVLVLTLAYDTLYSLDVSYALIVSTLVCSQSRERI